MWNEIGGIFKKENEKIDNLKVDEMLKLEEIVEKNEHLKNFTGRKEVLLDKKKRNF